MNKNEEDLCQASNDCQILARDLNKDHSRFARTELFFVMTKYLGRMALTNSCSYSGGMGNDGVAMQSSASNSCWRSRLPMQSST